MKTIETTVTVDEMGQFTVQLPIGVAPGRHRVVLVIDEIVDTSPAEASDDDIDTAFAAMADDSEYQAEALQIEREFSTAQWEALQSSEVEG
jgi:hypothetical protein